MHAAVDHLEAQGLMRTLGRVIINQRIGCYLDASFASRPVFCCDHELCSDALPAVALSDKPPFHISHRDLFIAAVGVRPQPNFDETQNRSLVALSHKDYEG